MKAKSPLFFQRQTEQSISTTKRVNQVVVSIIGNKQKFISLLICIFVIASTITPIQSQTNIASKAQQKKTSSTNQQSFLEGKDNLGEQRPPQNAKAQSQPRAELVVQTGHNPSEYIRAVAISPNGKYLASGDAAGFIKLWDVESGRELQTYNVNCAGRDNDPYYDEVSPCITRLYFSPDGKQIVVSGNDSSLFNLITREKTLLENESTVEHIKFSNDGQTLVGLTDLRGIVIWLAKNGRKLPLHKKLKNAPTMEAIETQEDIKAVALIENNNLLMRVNTIMENGTYSKLTVELWNWRNGKLLKKSRGCVDTFDSVELSPSGKLIAVSQNNTVTICSTNTMKSIQSFNIGEISANSLIFSPNERFLGVGNYYNAFMIWDLSSNKRIKDNVKGNSLIAFGTDGVLARDDKLQRISDGKVVAEFKGYSPSVKTSKFSRDGSTLFTGGSTIKLWDLSTGQVKETIEVENGANKIKFNRDGSKLIASGFSTITLLEVEAGKVLQTFSRHMGGVVEFALSSDEKVLASISYEDGAVRLWDTDTGKVLKQLEGIGDGIRKLKFSDDGKILFGDKQSWDTESGKYLYGLSPTFSNEDDQDIIKIGNRFIRCVSNDTKVKLVDSRTGQEIVSLIALDENDWVVTTPEGRFDTSRNLDSVKGLHWIVSDNPLTPIPLEIFMRDYYEPKLFPRLLKCNEEKNCDKEFALLPNIAELNRVQPGVNIANVSQPDANGKVKVSVEVSKTIVPFAECKMKKCQSDVFDLRLFRDGQLVGSFPNDAQEKLIQQRDFEIKDGAKRKELWRSATKVVLDAATGKKTLTFDVQLPKSKTASQVEFTAYSFNEDRVKSKTATKLYGVSSNQSVTKGRAYVVTIGVNANQIQKYNLRYAANDVRSFQNAVMSRLPKDKYEDVVDIPLISDYKKDANGEAILTDRKITLTENRATKANIKAVLDLLSGRRDKVSAEVLKEIPNAARIKKAQPEDTVIIFFSSHGYADQNGIFYLVPYDTGESLEKGFTSILSHCISSDELSLWLRDVDSMEMMMIVDACHSAAAVQGKDFKPGPMGSRGLGQLSYDKGMRILTATQADNIALELGKLEHSLLTYSLVKNGLEMNKADYLPKDNSIQSAEWLNYGVKDTPELYKAVKEGNFKLVVQGQATTTKEKAKSLLDEDEKQSNVKLQQPSLFDFANRRKQFILFKLN